jgi:hypothetical protein
LVQLEYGATATEHGALGQRDGQAAVRDILR